MVTNICVYVCIQAYMCVSKSLYVFQKIQLIFFIRLTLLPTHKTSYSRSYIFIIERKNCNFFLKKINLSKKNNKNVVINTVLTCVCFMTEGDVKKKRGKKKKAAFVAMLTIYYVCLYKLQRK